MSDVTLAMPLLDAQGVIQADISCARCGYNLRGLSRTMACPECATPVAHSLMGNMLATAEPEWLRTLRKGTTLKLWNILLTILFVLVGIVLNSMGVPDMYAVLLALPVSVVGVWAAFLITTQEPRVALHESPITLRRIVRTCVVIGAFEQIVDVSRSPLAGEIPKPILVVLACVVGLAAIVAAFGEFVYFRRFARRKPDERLARQTTIVMWGLAASAASMLLAGLVLVAWGGVTGGAKPHTATVIGMAVPGCAGLLGMVVFALWYVGLLIQYRDLFGDAMTGSPAMATGEVALPPAEGASPGATS